MTDDRHGPGAEHELDELLSLADQPLHFPDPERGELLDRVLRTATSPRVEETAVVPFVIGDRGADRPRRRWAVGVAASLVLILAVALTLVARQSSQSDVPADQGLPDPMTVEETCAMLPALAATNGLDQGPVQIADTSLDELEEVRRLLTGLSVDEGGPVASELVDDAVTRIRLLEIAIEASDSSTAAGAMTAARESVGVVIDAAC